MSGICGSIAFNPGAPVDGIDAMTGAAPWRGPDGVGVWRGEGAVLAHQALHVTPESRHEEQPLVDEEAGLVLVADARIDNRDELQRTLRRDLRRSVRRDVTTDTDLILAAYRRWGTDCAAHLLGDFAFAVWDRRKRQLFAARDPMAMRPFYYRIEDGRVLFGSEVKQILAAPGVPREIFEPMVAAWLVNHAGDPNWTFYDEISQLPQRHRLIVSSSGAHVDKAWDVDPDLRIKYRDDRDYAAHFREIFKDAVRARGRGDQPAGIFLSGGLDSCAVAGTAGWLQQNEPEQMNWPSFTTFSYHYEGFPQCDERHISTPLARHYRLPVVEIPSEQAWPEDYLLQAEWDEDSPVRGIYRPLQEYTLARAQERGLRQMFTGSRGDNMMGAGIWDHWGLLRDGYPIRFINELRAYRSTYGGRWPAVLRQAFVRPLADVLTQESEWFADWRRRRQQALAETAREKESPVPEWISDRLRRHIDFESICSATAPRSPFHRTPQQQRYETVFAYYTHMGNVQNAAMYAKYGMSYEDVWADRRIISFVCALPQYVLNRAQDRKRLTRQSMKGIFPPNVYDTASKIIPSDFGLDALAQKEVRSLRKLASTNLLQAHGYARRDEIISRVETFSTTGSFDNSIWPPITTEAWFRSHHAPEVT